MSVIYLMIPLAILLATAALIGFIWSVKRGQLDDFDTPPAGCCSMTTSSPACGYLPRSPQCATQKNSCRFMPVLPVCFGAADSKQ